MNLFLVRHGQTDWNLEHRAQGRSDTSLNATGRAQAETLRPKIGALQIQVCFSSPLKRALETAEILFPGREIITDPDLRERSLGPYEGRVLSDADWPKLMQAGPAEGVESRTELHARAGRFLDKLKNSDLPENVLIVAHNSILKALILNLESRPPDDFPDLPPLKNGEIRTYKI